jgi:hypothetical protein
VAGKLSAVLINTGGKYSPSNTSSALTGSIVPGRSIKLQAGSGSFPYSFPLAFNDGVRWQGKLDRIRPAPSSRGRKTATLTAFGTLGYLNQFETQLASQTNRRTDQAVGDILDDVGWTSADDRDLDTGLTTISRYRLGRLPDETPGARDGGQHEESVYRQGHRHDLADNIRREKICRQDEIYSDDLRGPGLVRLPVVDLRLASGDSDDDDPVVPDECLPGTVPRSV